MTQPALSSDMHETDVVVVGAGQSGLAISYFLSQYSIDHALLERGDIGNAWTTERWQSLRLLTPNWQTTLPGRPYEGHDPDGFMHARDVGSWLTGYAEHIDAPVLCGVTVERIRQVDGRYLIETNQGNWLAEGVVLASGACSQASVPALDTLVPENITRLTSYDYKNVDQLPPGPCLVVGASATGVQLADEIHASGRDVTLAVGEHVRMPRTHRARDIFWWMNESGILDEGLDDIDDIVRARSIPSPQLVGTEDRSDLDLNRLTERGVRLVGRLVGINEGKFQFAGSLANVCALADLKMKRLLKNLDEWASNEGMALEPLPPVEPTRVPENPPLVLGTEHFASLVWATGYRADFSYLDLDCFDRKGRIKHTAGVVDGYEGLVVMGLTFLRTRKSSFIHGAGEDAAALAQTLRRHLGDVSSSIPE